MQPDSFSDSSEYDSQRLVFARMLRSIGEAIFLTLVALAPWPFASVQPFWESVLVAGVGGMVLTWVLHSFLTGRFSLKWDLFSLCLSGLLLLTLLQLAPLPARVVSILSPLRYQLHQELLPDLLESIASETQAPRPNFLALTVDPQRTREFLSRVCSLLLLYLTVQNFLASRTSFQRLAWVLIGNGLLLAVVALAQMISSPPQMIFWRIPVENSVFGPFVNRNHFADYQVFCLAMTLAWLGREWKSQHRSWAWKIGLAAFSVFLIISILFSLSRGAILATAVASILTVLMARQFLPTSRTTLAIIFVLAGTLILGGSFGWQRVESRLATLLKKDLKDERMTVLRDTSKMILPLAFAGSGNGTFELVEPLTRTSIDALLLYEHAHNEYLEALIEGGLPRLLLTLALIGLACGYALQASRLLVGRSTGMLALGCLFALLMVSLHAITDFGIHMPAVAFVVVAITAHVSRAARDPSYSPQRFRLDSHGSIQEVAPTTTHTEHHSGDSLPLSWSLILPMLAAFLAWDSMSRTAADRFRTIARGPGYPPRVRMQAAENWVHVSPQDAQAYLALASLQLQENEISAGLASAQQARSLSPLLPEPHARIGRYCQEFSRSESARVHYNRARRLMQVDADVLFACGTEAMKEGDRDEAFTRWHSCLTYNPKLVRPVILAAEAAKIEWTDLLTRVLTGAPTAMLALQTVDRPYVQLQKQGILEWAAQDPAEARNATVWMAVARARSELNRITEAEAAWKRATETAPESQQNEVHERYAAWLEFEERYEDALVELQWLRARSPGAAGIRDRIEAARHAIKLQHIIESK